MEFRDKYESFTNKDEQGEFVNNYINAYLADFTNPVKNIFEYTDNMIRYIRLTKYIYIRGKYEYSCVDLEPRRLTEIDSILDNDDGSARNYSEEEWQNYMGNYGMYKLPFETTEKLSEILRTINNEVNVLEDTLSKQRTNIAIPITKELLKKAIVERRLYRTRLQNLKIKMDYHANVSKIDETIEALDNIRTHNRAGLAKKYSIELEKWSNIALNIINDSRMIKPNAPVGDDNEPIYTAPSGVADIECFYDNFIATCEVTTLINRDQWHNEGQPVMRHLRNFEEQHKNKPSYCIFIAPQIHVDTVNTFYMSVKYEYEGARQKIIPMTIWQLESILKMLKERTLNGKKFTHNDWKQLLDTCVEVSAVEDSRKWLNYINTTLTSWEDRMSINF